MPVQWTLQEILTYVPLSNVATTVNQNTVTRPG